MTNNPAIPLLPGEGQKGEVFFSGTGCKFPTMKKRILITLQLISLFITGLTAQNLGFMRGADISILDKIEDNGGMYTELGEAEDAITILKEGGINVIRFKLWHTPDEDYNTLFKVSEMAQRIKDHDLKFLLDIHYSDTWADPGHQTKPAAWQGLTYEILVDSVYQYSYDVVSMLKENGTLPDLIQIGNEINCGMLWPSGHVCGDNNNEQQWSQLAGLINAGITGIEAVLEPSDSITTLIHYASGNNGSCRWFFDSLIEAGVEFDCMGLSYYSWWHGSLDVLEFNVQDLSQRYDKKVFILETAYPWTLDWYDFTNNIIGMESQLHEGYPATVQGQEAFLNSLIDRVYGLPQEYGAGVFYWSPEWISTDSFGSPWENLALFDFQGAVLPGLQAFNTGDLNRDGSEDVSDILLIVYYIMGWDLNQYDLWRADLNGDQRIDVSDIIQLVNRILAG